MYFLQNFFIWIRKNIIRILLNEYPNKLLRSSTLKKNKFLGNSLLISSTDNFWVSRSMFKKWEFYSENDQISLDIYSNAQVNSFMEKYFNDDLIYEIFKKSIIPVQKMDIFRICIIYKFGGIWLDIKSQINLKKVLEINNKSNPNGILLYEPRKIEVISSKSKKQIKSFEHVIHNGFFFLPKNSKFLENLLIKIKKDYLYFQDIIFSYPKQGVMNLTGPHQFTRTFYNTELKDRPKQVSHKDIEWIYYSKFGEFISPLKRVGKHYSYYKELKILGSNESSNLTEK